MENSGKKLTAGLWATLLCLGWINSAQVSAGPIVGGQEWYQPIDLLGYSWNQFDSACPAGNCSGLVGGTGPDLTGWTWASIYDVGALFAATSPHPGGIATYSSASLVPINDFFANTGFTVTTDLTVAIDFGVSAVVGYSSTLVPQASAAYVGFAQAGLFPGFALGSTIGTNTSTTLDDAAEFHGAWLYRNVAVPVPATIPLFILALSCVGWMRRKRV